MDTMTLQEISREEFIPPQDCKIVRMSENGQVVAFIPNDVNGMVYFRRSNSEDVEFNVGNEFEVDVQLSSTGLIASVLWNSKLSIVSTIDASVLCETDMIVPLNHNIPIFSPNDELFVCDTLENIVIISTKDASIVYTMPDMGMRKMMFTDDSSTIIALGNNDCQLIPLPYSFDSVITIDVPKNSRRGNRAFDSALLSDDGSLLGLFEGSTGYLEVIRVTDSQRVGAAATTMIVRAWYFTGDDETVTFVGTRKVIRVPYKDPEPIAVFGRNTIFAAIDRNSQILL
jgi:hypothetical protein